MKPSLCLNMIVKNEADRIERALASVTATVKAAVILDTGSTDKTIELIFAWGMANKIPVMVQQGEFKNFSQARNDAFALARRVNGKEIPWCNFALLMDADMVLQVDDPTAFDGMMANAASYDMMQKAGTISYANRRIVNLEITQEPMYRGVTHEYLDIPSNGMVSGAFFIDHADGANRPEKFKRDIALLEADLLIEPENVRSWFYLGNSYRDAGQFNQAKRCYEKRIELGGWDEETHNSMMALASTEKDLNNPHGFIGNMLAAYQYRPQRAEPLYDLARYHREKGDNHVATLFAKAGMSIPKPNDMLFLNDFVYDHGLRYEYSVAGYYSEGERANAGRVANDLALDTTCPAHTRSSARFNMYWYTKRLVDLAPSFRASQIKLQCPDGYTAMNPSVVNDNGTLRCIVRTVNYKINEHGQYMIGPTECGDAPIITRNFLCRLDDDLHVQSSTEVLWDRPAPAWDMVLGLEDMRIFNRGEKLWFNACVRETNPGGVCQQVMGRLRLRIDEEGGEDVYEVPEWKTISGLDSYEKNWMHIRDDVFFHRLDRLVDGNGDFRKIPAKIYCGEISGSSQAIRFKDGWLAVVHEASVNPTNDKRTYWHRFVWWNHELEFRRISMPFVFEDKQIEFCAGLAMHPHGHHLVISYGVRDEEAHIAMVEATEVAAMLINFHED